MKELRFALMLCGTVLASLTADASAKELKFNADVRAELRFAHRTATQMGYAAGISTFSVLEHEDENAVYQYSGAVALMPGTVTVRDVTWKELYEKSPSLDGYCDLLQTLHRLAQERGFAAAHPNGELSKSGLGVIFVHCGSCWTQDADLSALRYPETFVELYEALRQYSFANHPKAIAAYPNGEKTKGKAGAVFLRRSAAEFIWLKR